MQVFEGFQQPGQVWSNLNTPTLYEHAVRRYEGLSPTWGPRGANRPVHRTLTQRKWIVDEPAAATTSGGRREPGHDGGHLRAAPGRLMDYLQQRELFVRMLLGGADERHRLRVRIVTERAWHSMFIRNMFIRSVIPRAWRASNRVHLVDRGLPRRAGDDGTRSEVSSRSTWTQGGSSWWHEYAVR